MEKVFFFISLLIFCISCGQNMEKSSDPKIIKFQEFKTREKFIPDDNKFYPGISKPELKVTLSNLINLAADDFQQLYLSGKVTDADYQKAIKIALKRFSGIYLQLDTEDRERICLYFEELMDIVELESSGGLLNQFMYNFEEEINK